MSYDDTSFYGDMIVDEYDDKCNFIGTNTPMGYLAYHLLGDGFDLMSDMCSKFMNDFSILSASASSLDKFWGVSYNMPRPSLPYLYTVLFEDGGTVQSHNDIWLLSNATLTRDDSYSTLLETTATGYAMSNQYNKIPPNSVVEFDICQTDGSLNYAPIYIRNDGGGVSLSNITYTNLGASIGDWVHIKIVFNNTNTITVYSDKLSEPFTKTLSATSTNYRVMLYCGGDMTTIKFKNFKVYDIVYPILFRDGGVTGDSNLSYWYYAPTYSSASVDTSGTTFTAIREGSFATVSATLTQNPTSTDIYPYSFPLTVEFDLIEWEDNQGTTTDYARIRVYNSANNNIAYWGFKDYGVGHYKVVCTEGSQKLYYNGVEQSRKFTFTPTTAWNVAFQTKGNIKYKNFVIYNNESPIYSTRLLSDEEYRVYLYLRNCRLITKEDLLINFNKCFGFDDYPIVFSDKNFYLETTDHINYEPTDTVSSNLHKNSEDTTLHFVTDYSNDETTEIIESGLSTEEELVTVINIPYNNWDKEFLEMLEQYISIKGNIKIKEYTL